MCIFSAVRRVMDVLAARRRLVGVCLKRALMTRINLTL